MATPALRALRHQYPDARLIGIVRPYVRDVLQGLPWFNEYVPVQRLGKSPRELWRVAHELSRQQADTMILMRRSLPAVALARLSGAKTRIGYGAGFAAWMLTTCLYPPRSASGGFAWSTCELYRRLVAAAGCEVRSSRLELCTSTHDEAAADTACRQLDVAAGQPFIVLNAGSATSPARIWPEEKYAELAQRLIDEFGARVVVHCGPKERDDAARLTARINRREARSLGEIADLPLGLSKALLRRASLLVTSDSGPRHVAGAFGTPTIVLSGPIDPQANANGNPNERFIWLKPECAPCNQSQCPLGHQRCLRDLSPEQVMALIAQLGSLRRSLKAA